MLTTKLSNKSSEVLEDFSQTLSRYIDLSANDLRHIIELPAEQVLENAAFNALVEGLNTNFLKKTLPEAQTAYTIELPKLMAYLGNQPSMDMLAMSAHTLNDWLIRFL